MRIAHLLLPHLPSRAFCRPGPLIVVERERVVDATVDAGRVGVAAGMTLERARSLCPEADVEPRDIALEALAWEQVLAALNRYTPRLEEAVTGHVSFRPPEDPPLNYLSRSFRARIGCGGNRSIAALAAVSSNIGEATEIGHAQSFFDHTPVTVLADLDFAEETVHRLYLFGLRSLGDVHGLTRRHLTAQFGEEGGRLYEMLHPSPDEPPLALFHPPETISTAYDIEQPHQAEGELWPALHHLSRKAAGALGERSCRRLAVRIQGVRIQDGRSTHQRAHLFREPVRDGGMIHRRAQQLLRDMLSEPPPRVDVLTLELGALGRPSGRQKDFFDRRPALRRILRSLTRRYPGLLVRAERQPHAPFDEETARLIPFGTNDETK